MKPSRHAVGGFTALVAWLAAPKLCAPLWPLRPISLFVAIGARGLWCAEHVVGRWHIDAESCAGPKAAPIPSGRVSRAKRWRLA